ncbi:MAG: hypothetical protein AB1384_07065 [Actinomycetota bacterium]
MSLNAFISRLHDEDGQVWSYVLKMVLAFVVIGIIVTQFVPIIMNYATIHNTADDAMDEAVLTYEQKRGNMQEVNAAVKKVLDDRDVRLVGSVKVVKGQAGQPDMLSLSVRKIRNTYLFENVGYLCRYTEASAYAERAVP